MSDFDWNQIKSFCAVAETGTLSAGARSVGISQPTMGRQIASLEESLGVTLFERQPRGMHLTKAGEELLRHASAMRQQASEFSIAATGQAQEIAGSVRVTASEYVAHFQLPPIVREIRNIEPKLQIEIVSSNDVQNLLTRDADIAIRMVEPAQSELIARKVNEVAMGVFASPLYLEKYGMPRRPEELLNHAIVGYDRNDLLIRGFAALGHKVTREQFAVRTDDQVLAWRLVEAGAGIGFGQIYTASLSPHVIRILPEIEIAPLPMWVATHRELRTSARIRRAFDLIADKLASLPLSDDPGYQHAG